MKQWVIVKWINYYLIGIVISKFEINGINQFLNGIRILIGLNIVLTVVHYLYHLNQNCKNLQSKKVVIFLVQMEILIYLIQFNL